MERIRYIENLGASWKGGRGARASHDGGVERVGMREESAHDPVADIGAASLT